MQYAILGITESQVFAAVVLFGAVTIALVVAQYYAPERFRPLTVAKAISDRVRSEAKKRKKIKFERDVIQLKMEQMRLGDRQQKERETIRKEPPPISVVPNQVPQVASHEERIVELLRHKARWDKLESGLRQLRDSMQIEGRINKRHKAEMITSTEGGHNLLDLISQDYPQYLYQHPAKQKSGCLGVVAMLVVPAAILVGWLLAS